MNFIPEKYISMRNHNISFWYSNEKEVKNLNAVIESCNLAREKINNLLDYKISSAVNVVLLRNQKDANIMGRRVPLNMLLTPYMSYDGSVIAMFSGNVSSIKQNDLVRHLAHELVHIANLEVTGSTKILGDRNINKNIETWRDEGLAEYISLYLFDRKKLYNLAKCHCEQIENLNETLDNINSSARSKAFKLAVCKIWSLLRENNHKIINGDSYGKICRAEI